MSSIARNQNRVRPVWERLPSIFAYPFKGACLVTFALATFFYVLALMVPLLGLVFLILAWVVLYKFAYDVLDATARGWMDPPQIQRGGGGSWVLAKTLGLFVALWAGVIGVGLLTDSVVLTVTVGIFVLLSLPAAIITLAITNSLLAALNPATWFGIMSAVGLPYFIAVLLLFMLSVSQGMTELIAFSLFGPGLMGEVVIFLVGAYFLVASFHLMGYLVYQHHDKLGVQPAAGAVDRARPRNANLSPLLQEVENLVAQGEVDDAIKRLRGEFRRGGLKPEEHERYRQLLRFQDRTEELQEHARSYISVLLYGFEQPKKALSIAEEAFQLDRDFQLEDPNQVRDLARLADQYNLPELVVRLTSRFGKENRHHPDLPENYYLGAKALLEGLGDEQKALNILRQLQKHFPDHELSDQVEELREQAERIAAT